MKVKDLIKILNEVQDDQMEVLIPVNAEFDGLFRSPCEGETGVIEIAADGDEEDEEPDVFTKMRSVFAILPHGFGDEHEGINPEHN